MQSLVAFDGESDPRLGSALIKGSSFGRSIASLGDLDGDGVGDVAVGAPEDKLSPGTGAVYVFLLNGDGSVRSYEKIDRTKLAGAENSSALGRSLACIGDVDGDGVVDLAVGDPSVSSVFGGVYGALWIVFLNRDGTVKASTRLVSPMSTFLEGFGTAVCGLGDQNGDGVPDIAVGSPGYANHGVGGEVEGLVWLLFLNPNGTVHSHRRLGEGLMSFPGLLGDGGGFGRSLICLGDRDGNGVNDLAVGAPYSEVDSRSGEVWIVHLRSKGTKVESAVKIAEGAGGFSGSLAPTDEFGSGLAAGDVDGDQAMELLVGTPSAAASQGQVWYLDLAADGNVTGDDPIFSGNGLPPDFYPPSAQFGSTLHLFDWEGDGTLELAAGTGPSSGALADDAVTVFSIGGGPLLTSRYRLDEQTEGLKGLVATESRFGGRLATVGDLDGDGRPEVAIGTNEAIVLASVGAEGLEYYGALTPGKAGVPAGIESFARADGLGVDMASLGDFDGDGVEDLLVEATAPEDATWILFLEANGTVREGRQIATTFGGVFCAIGDVDGDGVTDLVARDGTLVPALIRTFFLDPDGSIREAGEIDEGEFLRTTVLEPLGDTDGDGRLELAASGSDGTWILSIGSDGAISRESQPLPFFTPTIAAPGNLDLSGQVDLITGAPDANTRTNDRGAFTVSFLNFTGNVVESFNVHRTAGGNTEGFEKNVQAGVPQAQQVVLGHAVEVVGDINRDGALDVLFGVPTGNGAMGFNSGAVYLANLGRGFWSENTEHSMAAGGTVQTFSIDAGEEHAFRPYWILGSLAGTLPGLSTLELGLTLPLNFDGVGGYFLYSAGHPHGPLMSGGLGFLDDRGRATATFDSQSFHFPLLTGTTVYHAYAVFDPFPTDVFFVSNAVPSHLVD